jgi:hypothetical protein
VLGDDREVAPDVTAEWLAVLLVFWRSLIHISARRPAILTDDFRGIPQSLQTCRLRTLNYSTIASFHILSNSLFSTHPIIRHCRYILRY